MEISKTMNFTPIIEEKGYTFNPSIARWKENLYLCSYRTFIRYKNIDDNKYNPIYAPNHPWLGGENSTTWWKPIDGHDETGFLILSLESGKIKNVKSLNDGKSIYIHGEYFQPVLTNLKRLKAIDSRLIHIYDDFFLLSYNVWVSNYLNIKNGTCENGCFIIAARILKLNNGNILLYKENILCPSISNQTEKNWSFWIYNNNIYFSYGLAPNHSFYIVKTDLFNGDIICSPNPIVEKIGYYGYLENKYKLNGSEKFLFISVTTPAIPKWNDKNRYIGIGHVKYKHDFRFMNLIKTTPLGIFFNRTRNFKRHPIYDYLMFIYEFDPRDGEIKQITDMFLPEDTNYILSFPSGIEYAPDGNIIISYGDHDSFCKILKIKRDVLDKLLKPIDMKPAEKMNFFPLPKVCINKKDICSLILEI